MEAMRRCWSMVLVLGLAAASGTACAGTNFVWDGGAGDTDWSKPLNWDLDSGVPDDAGDTATIDVSGTSITAPAGLTLGALTLGAAFDGTLSLGKSPRIA